VEYEADGSGKMYKRPLSHLKRVPTSSISIDCDKFKDAVCYQGLRSKTVTDNWEPRTLGSHRYHITWPN